MFKEKKKENPVWKEDNREAREMIQMGPCCARGLSNLGEVILFMM